MAHGGAASTDTAAVCLGGPQNAYDPVLRALMHESAVKHSIRYTDGVFLSNLGPSFETPAEIKAYRVRGPGHACPARPCRLLQPWCGGC